MQEVVISGSGLYTPPYRISNDELVDAFNRYVERYNQENYGAIQAGQIQPLQPSSVEFIEKASGIQQRYVMTRQGILDPEIMQPLLAEPSNDQPCWMAQMAAAAAQDALRQASLKADDIDLVIVAASNLQRAYPAIAIEVQQLLGTRGYAFDMNVACSSATFGISQAMDAILSGMATRALVINPEICSGHVNFCDRDSHFIFGDACTAVLLERRELSNNAQAFVIVDRVLQTQFSNNIRNNFGFLNRTHPQTQFDRDKLFVQEGRKVFKEVLPLVCTLLENQLSHAGLRAENIKRLWLHQANSNMNGFIARKILGREPTPEEAPLILNEFANTSSAGSVIAFHRYHADFKSGELGILCSFGAGYSAGCPVMSSVLAE